METISSILNVIIQSFITIYMSIYCRTLGQVAIATAVEEGSQFRGGAIISQQENFYGKNLNPMEDS